MDKDFLKSKSPPIFTKKNQKFYFDSIRQKYILVTPEETIRQQVIAYLIDKLNVPENMIRVEISMSNYGIKSSDRADIVIEYDKNYPIAVIECKSAKIFLKEQTINQMYGYAKKLNCKYCMMTNGTENFCYHYDEEINTYIQIEELPGYSKMTDDNYSPTPLEKLPPRLDFTELDTNYYKYSKYILFNFGKSTPEELAKPLINFWESLIYAEHKLPSRQYQLFRVIEDCGIRRFSCGKNSSIGFLGRRSFLIENSGEKKFASIEVAPYSTKTSINVTISDDINSHIAMKLIADDNLKVFKSKCAFFHRDKFIDRDFVDSRYSQIVDGDRFYLGTLTNDRLWNLDEPEVTNFVENLISYALLRDEYREFKKMQ